MTIEDIRAANRETARRLAATREYGQPSGTGTTDSATPRTTLARWAALFERVEKAEFAPGVNIDSIQGIMELINGHFFDDRYQKDEEVDKIIGKTPFEAAKMLVEVNARFADLAPEQQFASLSSYFKKAALEADNEEINPHLVTLAAITTLIESAQAVQASYVNKLIDHPQVSKVELGAVLGIHGNHVRRWLKQRTISGEN